MDEFALVFDVQQMSRGVEERTLGAGFGLTVQGGLWGVDVLEPGQTPVDTAQRSARRLRGLGVHVRRLRMDLVSMAAIARRAGVSRSAVSKWVREVRPDNPFPMPYSLMDSGPVWGWGEIGEWLRRRGGDVSLESWRTPTVEDVEDVNHWLRAQSEDRRRTPLEAAG